MEIITELPPYLQVFAAFCFIVFLVAVGDIIRWLRGGK